MAMESIVAEICVALKAPPNGVGDSCFVSNKTLPLLKRHGVALLPAIETVLGMDALTNEAPAWFVDSNWLHLLLIYFEEADDRRWDSASFLAAIGSQWRHEALVAVFQIWGPARGERRRRAMPRRLFEIFHSLMQEDPAWVGDPEGLRRFVADASLKLV